MRIVGGIFAVMVLGCGGGNAASRLAQAPRFAPKDQTKCGVQKSQARPLIVEWPSADRQALESKLRGGVVAVRYQGCEMEVLDRCGAPAKYSYRGTTLAQDRIVMKDGDELYANLPVGAARLEGKLERSGQLTVDMSLVGRYEADKTSLRMDELVGDCTGATHFIYGVSVGAFDFYAGADATVGGAVGIGGVGAGGQSQAARETLTKNGDPNSCAKSTPDDSAPPAECGALIRIEVVPLRGAACASGSTWNGTECVAMAAPQAVVVPAPGAPLPPPTGAIAEPPPQSAVQVTFVPPEDAIPWSLHTKDGELLCSLPCTRWVGASSKYYLQKDEVRLATARQTRPLQVQVPDDLPYPVGSAVAATPSPARGSVVWPFVTGAASAATVTAGFAVVGANASGVSCYNSLCNVAFGVGVAGALGFVASVWWFAWSHGDRLETAPLNGASASGFTIRPTPTGLEGRF